MMPVLSVQRSAKKAVTWPEVTARSPPNASESSTMIRSAKWKNEISRFPAVKLDFFRCRLGWDGETCSDCRRLPGCKHGFCTRPLECRCEPGWTGLFCDIRESRTGCMMKFLLPLMNSKCRIEGGRQASSKFDARFRGKKTTKRTSRNGCKIAIASRLKKCYRQGLRLMAWERRIAMWEGRREQG